MSNQLSATWKSVDPDAEELWNTFSLDELVSEGKGPMPYGAKSKGPDPLMKHKKALKAPSYKVLTERYGQQPNLPPVTNRTRISKLADPMRGKFGNRVLDDGNRMKGEGRQRRAHRDAPVPEVSDDEDHHTGGGGGAFFLTGAEDEGEDYDAAMRKRRASKARQERAAYGSGAARRCAGDRAAERGMRGPSLERRGGKPSSLEMRAAARKRREADRAGRNNPFTRPKAKGKTSKTKVGRGRSTKAASGLGSTGGTQTVRSTRSTRGTSLERGRGGMAASRTTGARNGRTRSRLPVDLANMRVPESQRVKNIHDRIGPRSKRELNDSLRSEGSRASGGRITRISAGTGTTKPSRMRSLNKHEAASRRGADSTSTNISTSTSARQARNGMGPTIRQSRSSAGMVSRTAEPNTRRRVAGGGLHGSASAGQVGVKPSSVPANGSAAGRLARGARVRLKDGIPAQARGTSRPKDPPADSPRKAEPKSRPPLQPISGNVKAGEAAAKKTRGTFDSPPRYAPSLRKKEKAAEMKAAGLSVGETAFSELMEKGVIDSKVTVQARAVLADAAALVTPAEMKEDLRIIKEKVASSPPKTSVTSAQREEPTHLGTDKISPSPSPSPSPSSSSLSSSIPSSGTLAPEEAARQMLAKAQLMTQSGMSVTDSIQELRRAAKDASTKNGDKGLVKTQTQFIGQASRMMSKIQKAEEFSKKYTGLGDKGLDIGSSLGLE